MSAGLGGSPVDALTTEPSPPPFPRPRPQVPPLRGGTLRRAALLDRIATAGRSVVVVVAPAGYGKSTLLGQLTESLPGSCHLRLDETDDDPTVLMADLVDAIETVRPLDPGLRRLIATPAEFTGFRGPARLAQALAQVTGPLSLLLDDAHVLRDRTTVDWLAWILERLPGGVRVVIASRSEPGLPMGRLIAAGQLLELGPGDLALDARETEQLAELAGVILTPAEAADLAGRTEGWPLAIGLLLSAGAALDGGPIDAAGCSAGIVRYLRSELLERMDEPTRRWVLRSSVLDELTGPLCDAALDATGSLRMLRRLEGRNQLLLPQDAQRTTYHYHALYGEFLSHELEAALPGERIRIATRASDAMIANGRVVDAGRYVLATGDLDRIAAHVERFAPRLFWTGNLATVREWTEPFDRDGIRERYATVAVLGAWIEALQGNTTAGLRWLVAAERTVDRRRPFDGSDDHRGWVAALRAAIMPAGLAAHERDVDTALGLISPTSPLAPQVRLLAVVREVLAGRLDQADAVARDSEELARVHGANPGLMIMRAIRAAIAIGRGERTAARQHLDAGNEVIEQFGLEDYAVSLMVHAVGARLAAADGDLVSAQALLARVNRLRPLATVILPWHAVMVRLQAIRAAVALRDAAMARTLLGEIDDILHVRPEMGSLVADVAEVRSIVKGLRAGAPGPWTLTAAELRLLVYLPTHLTFREIAERMFLSPHTIKTQAMSIYGKLQVSSRREAIERAVGVSLLDPSVLHQADGAVLIA